MNARAISEMKSVPAITVSGTRSKQNGPIRIPAIMYAVTLGSLKSLVILVSAKPAKSIIDITIITTAEGDMVE